MGPASRKRNGPGPAGFEPFGTGGLLTWKKSKWGVVGATGYAGSEICRLIYSHPAAQLAAISSVSFEGMALSEVYPAYRQVMDLVCGTQEEVVAKSDVVFAALPHGLSQELGAQCVAEGKTFIDMGRDFRLESEADYKAWYGGTFTDPPSTRKRCTACRSSSGRRFGGRSSSPTPAATPPPCPWPWSRL